MIQILLVIAMLMFCIASIYASNYAKYVKKYGKEPL